MRIVLLICFTLSGVSGLIYEIVWTRKLGFIFGSTAIAVGVCLALYLAGLALGSYFAGPIADKMRRPARAYAAMELGIGICGLLSIPLLDATAWMYAKFEPLAFVLLALALLPPTVLIGGTLPVLIRATQRPSAVVSVTGRLYSGNTLGAVAGTVLAGFVLIPHWGMLATTAAAATLNLLLALVVWKAFGNREAPPLRPPSNPLVTADVNSVPAYVIWMVLAISGFCALLDEVIWTRSIEPIVGSSTWSLAIMLSPFLLGLALGIAAATRLVRAPSVLKRVGPVAMLAWAQSLTGAAVFAGVFVLRLLPGWFYSLYESLDTQPEWFLASQAALCGAISLIPAFCIGASFPLALAVYPNRSEPSRLVGRLYSINTAGAIVGACLSGVILIPWIGLRGGFLLAGSLNLALGAILLLSADGRWPRRMLAAIPVATVGTMLYIAPPWDQAPMATGIFNMVPAVLEGGQGFLPIILRQVHILYYREGATGTVAVGMRGQRNVLTVDGLAEASDSSATQVLLPHYAMATGTATQRALVIGYGSGNTAGSLALYPFEQIDVAEIEPATVEAGRFFEGINHRPDLDRRVRVHWADGRTWLAESPAASYDVIVSHPSMPWTPGSDKLFTREFFRLAHSRLRPGAVFAQSFPLYALDFRSVQSMLRTFADAFPQVLVVTSGRNAGELILLGSDRPLKLDWNQLDQLFATNARFSDLDRAQLPDKGAVTGRVLFGAAEIPALAGATPFNTDDNGLIEFASLTNLYRDNKTANTDRLFEAAVDVRNYITGVADQPRALLELTRAAVLLRDFRRGLMYSQDLQGYGDTYTTGIASGDVLYGLRRTPEAIAKWRHSLELQPGGTAALIRLIRHYRMNWPRDRPPEFNAWEATLAAKTTGAIVPVPPEFLNNPSEQ